MSRQYNSHTAPSSLRRASSASDAAANNSALASAASNAASAANGNGTTHNGGGSSSDLYQQLIDSNDLVKELDDIEAISQQISQHAEVLYQNWKSNSLPRTGGGGGGGGSTSLTTSSNNSNNPSSNQGHQSTNPQRAVSSSSTTYGAGVGFPKRPIIENGYSNGSPPPLSASSTISNNRNGNGSHYGGGNHHPHHNPSLEPLQPPQHHHQISGGVGDVKKGGSVGGGGSASPLSSPTSTLTSPSFINKTLPRSNSSGSGESPHHSSTTGATTSSASKLDLLTSPVVNGNLKDLVNSFVSTDRAKQAARQTISQTISNQMNRKSHQPNHHQFMRSPSPSNSAISASSTGSSFSSRGMSPPLRSPMLASSLGGQTSTGPGVVPSLPTSERRLMDAFPSNASIMNNVHTKMPPLFSTASITGGNGNNQNSNSTIGDPSSTHQQPLTISTTITPEQQQQQILPPKWPQDQTDQVGGHGQHQVIRIPVQHLPSSSSSSTSSIMDSAATNTSSANPPAEANLRSPTILHQMSSSSTPPSSSTTSAAGTTSIPSLHAAHVENMKKRFEEAKERINAMHQRATSGLAPFMGHPDPFADELDFFSRNRSRPQRPLVAPPHPELTPQQKQHISERSSPANLANSVNAAGVNPNIAIAGGVQPPKRFGGSVAERVMIFERCPIFGDGTMVSGLKEPRMPALLLNSKQTSAAAMNMIPVHTSNISSAPWRNLQQESMGKIQVIENSVIGIS